MHYYQFNIGDYAKSTLHLSEMEDLAYRRLLDRYYDTEKPLESDIDELCRYIRMVPYKKETQQVLSEFFNLTKKGWIQKRVQKELSSYARKASAARANGKKGGRPKKTQSVSSGNPVGTHDKTKQEPLTNNHKPITNNQKERGGDKSPRAPNPEKNLNSESGIKTPQIDLGDSAGVPPAAEKKPMRRFKKPTLEELQIYFRERGCTDEQEPIKFANYYESNGWRVGKSPMKDWQAAARNWLMRCRENKLAVAKTSAPRSFENIDYSAGVAADGSF